MSSFPPVQPLRIPPRDPHAPRPTEAEIDAAMAWIDGVNGSGGHHLTEPYLRGLLRQQIAGHITGEEAAQRGMAWLERKYERERKLTDIAARMWASGSTSEPL